MRKKSTPLKTLLNKADKLAAAWCKRDGECAANGYISRSGGMRCSDRIEWAHLKSRGDRSIRHDPRNALPLCNVHHRYFTVNPDEWVKFTESVDPGVWDYLNGLLIERKNSTNPKKLADIFAYWIDWYQARMKPCA